MAPGLRTAPLAPCHAPLLVAALLAAATAASVRFGDVLGTPHVQRQVLVTLAPSFHLAAALLLPLPAAFVVPAATVTAIQVRRHPAFYKQTFNASVYVLGMLAAAIVFRAALGGSQSATRFVLAAAGASLLYSALDGGAFVAYFWLAVRMRPRESGFLAFWEVSSRHAFGVLIAASWSSDPVLVVLVVPLGVMLQRAVVFRSVERAARLEPKTGLLNDRAFRTGAARVLARAARDQTPTALLMLDLDHLREINNGHGHLAGDRVIARIAEVLRAELRDRDLAARFGGEEFAVLLPCTPAQEAKQVAERVRVAFRTDPIDIGGGTALHASVSVGVAARAGGTTLEDLTALADHALYEAKAAGRDQVRTAAAGATALPVPRLSPERTTELS